MLYDYYGILKLIAMVSFSLTVYGFPILIVSSVPWGSQVLYVEKYGDGERVDDFSS